MMTHFSPKHVLVAFDMSDVSRTAWKHAAALAETFGASLDVVYVEPWQTGVDLMPPPELTLERIRLLRRKIASIVGAKAKVAVVQGNAAERVLELARRRRADLIVVGTHGRSGLKRVLLGSTAEDIIRASPVPVLAARGPVRRVRSILAPVNFTSYAEYGLTRAAEAGVAMKAEVTALHVTDDPIWSGNLRFRLERMLSRLPAEARKRCRVVTEVGTGKPADGIIKARKGHDWIVLVAHVKSAVKAAFFGTTLERVLRRSEIPVLCLPSPRRTASAARGGRGLSAAGAG